MVVAQVAGLLAERSLLMRRLKDDRLFQQPR